jgi:TonB family protein
MKTTLLYIGAALFFISCEETLNEHVVEDLSVDEMKARVEVEEILFEKESVESGVNLEKLELVEPEIKPPPGHDDPLPDPFLIPKEVGGPRPPLPVDMIITDDPDENGVFFAAEIDAQFPGGMVEMKKFIASNLKYPNREVSYQGKVYVSFVVGKDGGIEDEKVFRGVSKELDAEALRVIRAMPNWIPAENNGKIVAAKVRLPISFK